MEVTALGIKKEGVYNAQNAIMGAREIGGEIVTINAMEPKESMLICIEHPKVLTPDAIYKTQKAMYGEMAPEIIPVVLSAKSDKDGIKVYVADSTEDCVTIGIENTTNISKEDVVVMAVYYVTGRLEKVEDRKIVEHHMRAFDVMEYADILKKRLGERQEEGEINE